MQTVEQRIASNRPPPGSFQRGFTLIEILISVFVLAVGLLGVAALQSTSLQTNHSAYLRSQATALGYDAIDRMRANQVSAGSGQYDIAIGAAAAGAGLPLADLTEWKALLGATLPSGDGSICRSANGTACAANGNIMLVTVQWDDTRGQGGLTQLTFSGEL